MRTLRHFEWFVAARYLRAKRKQAVISVITVISVLGVAAGVLAMVVALAINAGFRETLEKNLLGATAHVTILEKQPGEGIANWRVLARELAQLPHVRGASPGLYGSVFLNGPLQSAGAILKGVAADRPPALEALAKLKEGAFARLAAEDGLPGIVLGSRLAQSTGMTLDAVVQVISPQGELTPFGPRPSYHRFRVVGIFESGFYDLDSAWAFTSLEHAQRVLSLPDVVNTVELSLDDVHAADHVAGLAAARIGERLGATTWGEQNGQILNALRMERIVTAITIGLIQLVAALNILITLVMMVMEKHRDIAVLLSMGARAAQIRRIFVLKGLMIGLAGTAAGLAAAYPLCYLAGRYRWIRLDEQIYALSYVPFAPRWSDGLWIAAAALGVSVLATLYPARSAARILPAEALRYE